MRAGDIQLDPIVSDNKITFLKYEPAKPGPRDLFSELFGDLDPQLAPEDAFVEEFVTLKSDPVTIHVEELPANAPADFKGAVGNFTISAALDKATFSTNGSANLTITLEGSGNLQLLNAPAVALPENVEGYDPKIYDQFEKNSVPLTGRKVFTYPITASKAGNYTIEPIRFSYFDPKEGRYRTDSTQALELHITAGTTPAQTFAPPAREPQMLRWLAVLAGAAILSVVALFILRRRKRHTPAGAGTPGHRTQESVVREIREEFEVPQNPLATLHQKLQEGNSTEFYRELYTLLKGFLAKKLEIPAEHINRRTVHEELEKRNIGVHTSLLINSLFEEAEINLYSAGTQGDLSSAFERASQLVSLVNKQCPANHSV